MTHSYDADQDLESFELQLLVIVWKDKDLRY